MLKLGRVTKVKVLFLVLVFVFNFGRHFGEGSISGYATKQIHVVCEQDGNQVVLMLTSLHLHEKNREVCIKASSTPTLLAFMAR